ncbi:hypothetical protein NDN01_07625 [Sphingomonas sp. QA11]|uniref:hypothetical protein n=1 Tax=Sphingomonas sp. QA11 TaxID=2950605 RepID=UPI0023493C7C|nr:MULTISPECIES: hypothetical protein [unclassified Sphingomonas]WCM28766.1 hypothetical protein NDN01_07625 [Sphingomonas sp. QA11]WEK01129.1 MAG: hypothetical protein P0Y59_05415 [Sphingomonas sp.]
MFLIALGSVWMLATRRRRRRRIPRQRLNIVASVQNADEHDVAIAHFALGRRRA